MLKTCSVCNDAKELDLFPSVNSKWRRTICNACVRAQRNNREAGWTAEQLARKRELARMRVARSRARLSPEALQAKRQAERAKAAARAGREYVSREVAKQQTAEKKAAAKTERAAERKKTHGMSNTAEYRAWVKARSRCTNKHDAWYWAYGGRGIPMCQEFVESFEAFYQHIGPKSSPELVLDRIDNNKGYVYGNIRWASPLTSSNNRRPPSQWRVHPSVSARRGNMMRWAKGAALPMHESPSIVPGQKVVPVGAKGSGG
jgi:hypothetical protein